MRKWGIYRAAAGMLCAGTAIALVCAAVQCAGRQITLEEAAALHTRVRTAAISCYAAEGRYPRSLSYLEEAYGLRYDKARFAVYYEAFASNVLPDIDVQIIKGA